MVNKGTHLQYTRCNDLAIDNM